MTLRISKDTQLCISMSARPSNIGTRFHNYLYEQLELDFVYKAFAPRDIVQAVEGIRGLGIRGAAVSMPFKQAVLPLLDEVDHTASVIEAVNTIVNTDGYLKGYNTDFIAVRDLLSAAEISRDASVFILGSGGMARAVLAAVTDLGFADRHVVARNPTTASPMADQYRAALLTTLDDRPADVIINATPIGMAGGPEAELMPVALSAVANSQLIFDVVAVPAETPLIRAARDLGKAVITGREVMTLQAIEQFVLYTGIRPTADQARAASEFANS